MRRPGALRVGRCGQLSRRAFIAALATMAMAAPPLAARAQEKQVRRIALLSVGSADDPEFQSDLTALREALGAAGWVEGHNLEITIRWTATDTDLMRRGAQELVGLKPELILSSSTPTTAALMRETKTIPIVFMIVGDPVGSRFVQSMSHPGGNITGFATIDKDMTGKCLELLKQIAPPVTTAAIIFNPATEPRFNLYLEYFKASASAVGVEVEAKPVHDGAELEPLFASLARQQGTGIIPLSGAFSLVNHREITALAARYRLPAVYALRAFAEAGGVLSYGIVNADNWRRAAAYADRILKGEKPADLPVQFPVKFELVINLKTAKEQGLAIPATLLATADQVIE